MGTVVDTVATCTYCEKSVVLVKFSTTFSSVTTFLTQKLIKTSWE